MTSIEQANQETDPMPSIIDPVVLETGPEPTSPAPIQSKSNSNLSKAASFKSTKSTKSSDKRGKSPSQKSKVSIKSGKNVVSSNPHPINEQEIPPVSINEQDNIAGQNEDRISLVAASLDATTTPTPAAKSAINAEKEALKKEQEKKAIREREKQKRKEKARKERENKEREERLAVIRAKEEREKAEKEKQAIKEKQAKAAAAAKKTPPVTIPNDVTQIDPLAHIEAPSPEGTPKRVATFTEKDQVVTAPLPPIFNPKDPFPYRHFTSLHPCANRLLAMKWDRDDRKKHLKKLAAVKPQVDNCAPKLYRHLQTKPKKHQMDQERQAEIHRNNRILLERMSNIMYMEAHDPEIHATRRFQVLTNAGPRARAREQIKIALENKKLFERLQGKQPDYNRHKLLDQHFKHLLHLQNISSYPQKYMDQRNEYEVILRKLKCGTASNGRKKVHAHTADTSRLPHIPPSTVPKRPATSGDLIGAL